MHYIQYDKILNIRLKLHKSNRADENVLLLYLFKKSKSSKWG